MKAAYKVLSTLIAIGVFVQAGAIAMWVFGMFRWLDEGNSYTADSEGAFPEQVGQLIHSFGSMLIPLLALILLVVSFFAKIAGGVKWAAFLLLAIVVQFVLGILSFGVPYAGLLHGINGLLVLGLAVAAARRATSAQVEAEAAGTDDIYVGA